MEKDIKFEEFIEISVFPGRKIHAPLVRVPLSKIKLDSENVRFAHLNKKFTDQEMEEIILQEDDTQELCDEIEFSEGLREKPVINSDLVVKEGSRRISCLRELVRKYKNNPEKRKKYDTVQCIMFPKETPPKEIALYLAGVHVSGKKPWDALNKASHIYTLYNQYKMTYDEIRVALRMGKGTVMRAIKAYKYHTEYGKKYGNVDEKWLKKYSYFDEVLKRGDLKPWSESEENIQEFMEWLRDNRIEAGMEVRDLSRILENNEAFKIFKGEGGTVKKALEYLSLIDPTVGSKFYSSINRTLEEIDFMPREELMSTIGNRAKIDMLKELRKKLDDLISDIERLKNGG